MINPPLLDQHVIIPDIPSVTSVYMAPTLPKDNVETVTQTTYTPMDNRGPRLMGVVYCNVTIEEPKKKYKIQELMISGWEDPEWTVGDTPCVFDSVEQAQAEIDKFVKEIREAFEAGNMADAYHVDHLSHCGANR